MEDQLRLFLLLGGTVFIIGVLAHGIWKIRKNTKPEQKTRLEPRQWEEDENETISEEGVEGEKFDELGLGEVRVVHKAAGAGTSDVENLDDGDSFNAVDDAINAISLKEPPTDTHGENEESACTNVEIPAEGTEASESLPAHSVQQVEEPAKPEPKLYGSVVSNPKPHMAAASRGGFESGQGNVDNVADFPEPPGFLLKEDEEDVVSSQQESDTPVHSEEIPDFSLDSPEQPAHVDMESKPTNEQSKRFTRAKRTKPSPRKREEPNFGDDQMRIDFDDNAQENSFSATDESDVQSKASSKIEPEVLVLNVRAPEDAPIAGAALLPMLLTLGFKFGDQDIFHRHVNSNGKGPVLFSLANMFKPGIFDIDNLENFETQGVSLFMILPIEGDPHQVFNMMHNAARKLADEFSAQVLDGRRSVLTKQGLQQYVEKIREFERKRMIARS